MDFLLLPFVALPLAAFYLSMAWIAEQRLGDRSGLVAIVLIVWWMFVAFVQPPFAEILGVQSLPIAVMVIIRPSNFCWSFGRCVAATFGVCVLGFLGVAGWKWREFSAERVYYPFEDLSSRLAVYRTPTDSSADSGADDAFDTAAHAAERFDLRGRRSYSTLPARSMALEALHERRFAHFVLMQAFGAGRMLEPYRDPLPYLDLPPSELAEQPSPRPLAETGTPDAQSSAPPNDADLFLLNYAHIGRFANRLGWGYAVDKTRVAGFQAHCMARTATDARDDKPLDRWKVDRIELVSLLKFDKPGVYVSEKLPAMNELKNAATRPLDGFERAALPKLRAGADIETAQISNSIRMLGAIRAATACCKCHAGKSGDLLGAFSYRLVAGSR